MRVKPLNVFCRTSRADILDAVVALLNDVCQNDVKGILSFFS